MPGPASIPSQALCWGLGWALSTALMLRPQGPSSTVWKCSNQLISPCF